MKLDEKLNQMLALAEKATPGPWYQKSYKTENESGTELSKLLCYFSDEEEPRFWHWNTDGEFVASARTDWPATVRALQIALKALSFYEDPFTWARVLADSLHGIGTFQSFGDPSRNLLKDIAKELGCEIENEQSE